MIHVTVSDIPQVGGVRLIVTSRQVAWLFLEQFRLEYVPVLHRLQWRLAAQC